MAQTEFPGCPEPRQRTRVRLLFAGFIVAAVVLSAARTIFGEPYPAPFMPPFKGTGLKMVSATEASVIVPKITVIFTDQTMAEVPQATLFGDIPSPVVHRRVLFRIVPEPDLDQSMAKKNGLRQRMMDLLHVRIFQPPPPAIVPDDVRSYLHRRLETIYPSKTAVSLTISLYREIFPVPDLHHATAQLASERVITFP